MHAFRMQFLCLSIVAVGTVGSAADDVARQAQPPATPQQAFEQIRALEAVVNILPYLQGARPATQTQVPAINQNLNREGELRRRQLNSLIKNMDQDAVRAMNARDVQAELSQAYLREFTQRREAAYNTLQSLAGREIADAMRASVAADQGPPRPSIKANLSHAESIKTEFLSAFGDKLAALSSELGKDHPQVREMQARYDRLSTMVGQVVDAYQKSQTATTKGEEAFYLKVANSMEDSINRIAHGVFEQSPFPERPPVGDSGPDLIQGIEQSLYEQQQMLLNWAEDTPGQHDIAAILRRAEQDFGEGRAGAGERPKQRITAPKKIP
ncbi:MAG: hypothetical protein JNL96_20860 [Planctomycetaceae bacterium]|nr:hypothetical protein [Planctomycetaceae bacterium]